MIKSLLLLFSISICAYADPAAYAQLSSLTTQVPPSTKPVAVIMDRVDVIHNFEVSPKKDKLIAKVAGVYFVLASGQCASTTKTTTGNMDLWFVKNSSPVPNSNTRVSVDQPGSLPVLVTQFLVALAPGDSIATYFSTTGPSLGLLFSQPYNEPANTSFFFSIFKVD